MLLRRAGAERQFEVNWRFFSLTQVNHRGDPGWKVWTAAADEHVKGRRAFAAASAARRQGEAEFGRFHRALLDLRHVGRLHVDSPATIEEAATYAGLDHARLLDDLADPTILDELARDHTEAVEEHGIFGTPTLVMEDKRAAYVRLKPAPEGKDALDLFDHLVAGIAEHSSLLELKRPEPPRSQD